jgi:hypothetical protein
MAEIVTTESKTKSENEYRHCGARRKASPAVRKLFDGESKDMSKKKIQQIVDFGKIPHNEYFLTFTILAMIARYIRVKVHVILIFVDFTGQP